MQQTVRPSLRWQRRAAGIGLYHLIWTLPAASFAILLLEILKSRTVFGIGPRPLVFAIVFVLFATVIQAALGKWSSRVFPFTNAARVCNDDTLPTAEKVELLKQDSQVWRALLTNTALLSLFVIAALSIR